MHRCIQKVSWGTWPKDNRQVVSFESETHSQGETGSQTRSNKRGTNINFCARRTGLIESFQLLRQRGRNSWASDTRSPQVLNRNQTGDDTSLFACDTIVEREVDLDIRVVYCFSSDGVILELADELVPRWRALARDLGSAGNCAIAVSSS